MQKEDRFARYLKMSEWYVLVLIIFLAIIIQLKSGKFFTSNNLVDLSRNMVVPGMMSMALLMVILSGNIDVSFPYIAMLSMFSVTKLFQITGYTGSIFLGYLIAAFIGGVCGFINGFLVSWLNVPSLIITLSTCTIYTGITQGVLKSSVISMLPEPLYRMSQKNLLSVVSYETGLQSTMPISFLLFIGVMGLVYFILHKTMLGRGIYAVGGDALAAKRVGFNVKNIQIFVFTFSGIIGAIAGLTQVTITGMCQINYFDGYEMPIIATVVLGGANITGGTGGVFGTFLAVLLMAMISNNLILLGIPTNWTSLVMGTLILIGASVSAIQYKRRQRIVHTDLMKKVG